MTPRSLSLSTRSSFSTGRARFHPAALRRFTPHRGAVSVFLSRVLSPTLWHFDIFSSSHSISTAVADPVSMPSIDPSQPPASTCSLPACVPSLSLSVNPSNVSRSSEKRSLVSCAIPHSPLPTFHFFPRGRSSDASQIHQPVGALYNSFSDRRFTQLVSSLFQTSSIAPRFPLCEF